MNMKKYLFILSALFLAGCTLPEGGNNTFEFTATLEDVDTKVYVDNGLKTHWTKGDAINILTPNYNEQYKYDGNTGDTKAVFRAVVDKLPTEVDASIIFAVYPYSSETSLSSSGVITVNLPAIQYYSEDSFGLGANTMVATAEPKTSQELFFKSLCGYVVVMLYGDATVKSITLTGNNGEKIAGVATMAPVYGQNPEVVMSGMATTSISVDCGAGVKLGETAETATAFWFAVPPVTFSQGFTIRITDNDSRSVENAIMVEHTVNRNLRHLLSPIEVNYDALKTIEFEDANFKAYCVENFDTNGDGEISYAEAALVKQIKCDDRQITSLGGIQHFTSLLYLACYNNQLKSLDVSNNTALTKLNCSYNNLSSLALNNTALKVLWCQHNQITALDISKSPSLTLLNCGFNQISSLDVSNNPALDSLGCYNNQIPALDLSKNTGLEYLTCYNNKLSSLDLRNNTTLTHLSCYNNQISSLNISSSPRIDTLACYCNQLTVLDLSKNTGLKYLACRENKLTSLDFSNNTALTYLTCHKNQLSSLDIHNNAALTYLDCGTNKLSSLDVSNNTSLTKLYCKENLLTSLDVSKNPVLELLRCQGNKLTSLDVSKNALLNCLWCYSNPSLTEIWLKTGQTISDFQYDSGIATIKYKD